MTEPYKINEQELLKLTISELISIIQNYEEILNKGFMNDRIIRGKTILFNEMTKSTYVANENQEKSQLVGYDYIKVIGHLTIRQ